MREPFGVAVAVSFANVIRSTDDLGPGEPPPMYPCSLLDAGLYNCSGYGNGG